MVPHGVYCADSNDDVNVRGILEDNVYTEVYNDDAKDGQCATFDCEVGATCYKVRNAVSLNSDHGTVSQAAYTAKVVAHVGLDYSQDELAAADFQHALGTNQPPEEGDSVTIP